MHRGSLPTTRKRHSCHLCSVVEKKLIKIPGTKYPQKIQSSAPKKALVHFKKKKENVFKKKKPKKVPTSKRLDMFFDQEGGGNLITPVRAIVEQAKALLRRKCRRKGCRQAGARVSRRKHSRKHSRRKVYNPNRRTRNPKRTTKKSKRTKKSKHGRNSSAGPFYFKTKN